MLPAARKKPKNQKKKAVPKWRYRSRKRPMAKPTPNPNNPAMSTAFIGFLREYQRRNTIVDVKKRLQRAAKMWSKLSKAQKNKFRTAGGRESFLKN
nr:IP15731p [Drosophila melanogaster]